MKANERRIGDVNLKTGEFDTDTKTGNFIKTIPEDILNTYKQLGIENANPEAYVFGRGGLFQIWEIKDANRREHYTKCFKVYKDAILSDRKYTMHSIRTNGIIEFFVNRCNELKANGNIDYKTQAMKDIMPFTNHTTIKQVKDYLRDMSFDIDVKLSDYIKRLI